MLVHRMLRTQHAPARLDGRLEWAREGSMTHHIVSLIHLTQVASEINAEKEKAEGVTEGPRDDMPAL